MKIMLDTNILISAGVFPNSKVARIVKMIALDCNIVISSYAIEELWRVTDRKFPDRKPIIERFLSKLTYEIAYTPTIINVEKYPQIRDVSDYPILASAMNADVDILISGDKDFGDVDCERPEIMTIAKFEEQYL